MKATQGVWVKLIAGDDALLSDAIENVIKIGNENPTSEIILTLIKTYNDVFTEDNLISIRPQNWQSIPAYGKNATPQIQLEHIFTVGHHFTPGLFVKKNVYEEIGYFEEQYTLIEDVPFYLKLGLNNKLILFSPVITVKYRIHQTNISRIDNKIFPGFMYQNQSSIYQASLIYGKTKFILQSFWNKIMIYLIMKLGNKGYFLSLLNKIRLTFRPLRFYSLLDKLKSTSE